MGNYWISKNVDLAFDEAMTALERLKDKLARDIGLKEANLVIPIYDNLDGLRDSFSFDRNQITK